MGQNKPLHPSMERGERKEKRNTVLSGISGNVQIRRNLTNLSGSYNGKEYMDGNMRQKRVSRTDRDKDSGFWANREAKIPILSNRSETREPGRKEVGR